MGKKEIVERNIEIAKFQGAKVVTSEINGHLAEIVQYKGDRAYSFDMLVFHKDWDWIMPLVKTIQNKIKKGNTDAPLFDQFKIFWNNKAEQYEVTFQNSLSSDPRFKYWTWDKSEKIAVFTVISDLCAAFNAGTIKKNEI